MNGRDCFVIDHHFPRLQQCLEPSKLLRYLERVGVLDEEDVETIRQENIQTSRENQVKIFVDILKRREGGFKYLLKALLTSKVQDYLARELLQDDVYNEEEISNILAELENDLDETQALKLRLLEEQKRHTRVAKELANVKRNSLVFSDSGSSGLFIDYDSTPSEEGEMNGTYSPRESMAPREDDQSTPLVASPLATDQEFEWDQEDDWKRFGSVDQIDLLSNKRSKKRLLDSLWKSASLGRLNEIKEELPRNSQRRLSGLSRWNSEDGMEQRSEVTCPPANEIQNEKTVQTLEEKLAIMERQLQNEKRKRQISEHEVAKLQLEKEELYEELEGTREQMRTSQLNLYYEDEDFEEELCFGEVTESQEMYENGKRVLSDKKIRFSPVDCQEPAAQSSLLDANQLQSQTERMRKSRLTGSWKAVNARFYELDEYEDEIKFEMDPRNILDTLRRLKTYTSCLYDDILSERDELQALKKRAERLENT